jgi:hypothetical protein
MMPGIRLTSPARFLEDIAKIGSEANEAVLGWMQPEWNEVLQYFCENWRPMHQCSVDGHQPGCFQQLQPQLLCSRVHAARLTTTFSPRAATGMRACMFDLVCAL